MNMSLFPPESSWTPPKKFPNLSGAKILGVDLETKDPCLLEQGPGSFRNDGFITGISLSTNDASWYFPYRHLSGGNLNQEAVISFMQDVCKTERTWIGANLQYEMEWLAHDNIEMKGKFVDVQIVQALIDEEQESNALNVLCKQYLGHGKDEVALRVAASAFDIDPKSEMWKLHSKYVGQYAEFDSRAPLEIFKRQWVEIQKQQLEEVFTLEAEVTPILWKMRQQGVRIDLEGAAKLSRQLMEEENNLRLHLKKMVGGFVDEWSGKMLADICRRLNISFPQTSKGNPSFAGDWLDNQDHEFLKSVSKLREVNRLRSTFIDDWIFKHHVDGVIHPQWKQLVADDGGTRTGRLAASNPNPQQVPSRADIAPLIRALFIPMFPDEEDWNKYDYSQQEPRLLVHFAYLCKFSGADVVRLAYKDNPKMDIYSLLAQSAGISRRESKDITLGRMYGMGAFRMGQKLGISKDEAQERLNNFDTAVPFVKELSDLCANKAQERGWLRTLCGRRRHFNWWEPVDSYQMKKENKDVVPRKREAAEATWPGKRLKRAHTHKGLNSVIQGSAADATKSALVQIYKETGRIPYLQVHDELDYGITKGDLKSSQQVQYIAENCVKTEVVMKADLSIEAHWK